jgi:hypothetical protein
MDLGDTQASKLNRTPSVFRRHKYNFVVVKADYEGKKCIKIKNKVFKIYAI